MRKKKQWNRCIAAFRDGALTLCSILTTLIRSFFFIFRVSFRRNKNKEAKEEKKDTKSVPKEDVSACNCSLELMLMMKMVERL